MNLFARIRQHFFPLDDPDWTDRDLISAQADNDATEQARRAIELMKHWDKERADALRRIVYHSNMNVVEDTILGQDTKP